MFRAGDKVVRISKLAVWGNVCASIGVKPNAVFTVRNSAMAQLELVEMEGYHWSVEYFHHVLPPNRNLSDYM